MNIVQQIANDIIKASRHHKALRYVANRLGTEYNFKPGENTTIGRNVDVLGSIKTGQGVTIGDDVLVTGDVKLADEVSIGDECHLRRGINVGFRSNLAKRVRVRADIDIGRYCAIAHEVAFQSSTLRLGRVALQSDFQEKFLGLSDPAKREPISIGHDVYIGRNAIILPGVEIGTGAVVGAGAVVTDDVEPYTVVGGNPAKQISRRVPEETATELQSLEWWKWSEKKLGENSDFFDQKVNRKTASPLEYPYHEDRSDIKKGPAD